MPRNHIVFAGALAALVVLAPFAFATVVGSNHDLSTTGDSDRVCAFCHTPHGANIDVIAPLWNRFVDLNQTFTLYDSATLDTIPDQPTNLISGICLGCHDGTIGTAVYNAILGSTKHDLINAPGPGGTPDMTSYPNCRRCHGEMYGDPPAVWQGTDLRDDHPISMIYPTTAQDPAFNLPPNLTLGWTNVPLYSGRVECPTCHNVHEPMFEPFLRISNSNSALCVTCHIK